MAKTGSNNEQNISIRDLQEMIELKKALENEASRSFSTLFEGLKKEQAIRKNILAVEKDINAIQKIIAERESNGIKLSKQELKLHEERKKQLQQINIESKILVNSLDRQKMAMSAIKNESSKLLSNMSLMSANGKELLKYMDAQDGHLKATNLQLGITNDLGNSYGLSLLKSAEYTARLGVSSESLLDIQNEYVNETGRLTQLNTQNFKDISQIAAGTGMAADAAGRLVGQFELFGLGISQTKGIIEDTINAAGNYGISSGKLLSNMSKNIDKLNKYNFKSGVQGLIEMTKYSLRFKTDMEGTFAAMDKSRTLEGSLDMASKLMVMGGKFASADPFQLMFLARNDPAKYQEALNKMTEGTAVFNKTTKEFDVGAYDLDRLRMVAEATGKDYKGLVEEAKRFASIKMAKNQMFAGSKDDREMVATISKIGKNGQFQVEIKGDTKDISKLTSEDIKLLKQQEKTLEQRAIDSQNFDATLKNLIMEFKSTFLPLLTYTNEALKIFRSVIDGARSILPDGSFKLVAMAVVAGSTLFGAAKLLMGAFSMGSTLIGGLGKGAGSLLSKGAGGAGAGGGALSSGSGASAVGTTANYARAASIAAIGVAAVGIGYGIKLASEGFGYLGEVMQKLNLETQNRLLGAMALTFAGFTGIIIAAGYAGTAALPGLLGVAAAAAGIGLAAGGVGYLIDKLNSFNNPEAQMINAIKGVDFGPMQSAFREVNKFLKADMSNLHALVMDMDLLKENAGLDKVINNLSKKLDNIEVRFAPDQQMTMNINNVIEIDGERIVKKHTRNIMIELNNSKRGRSSLSI